MKCSRLLLECIKEQPQAHQRAAESTLSRSTNKYTKESAVHFCNALFCAQFFDYLFLQRFTLCSIFDYLFLQRFILRTVFLIIYVDFDYVFLYI